MDVPKTTIFDTGPEDRSLTHRTCLGCCIKHEFVAVDSGIGQDQLIDGVNLPVKCRLDRRFVPALGQNLATPPIHDQSSEGKFGNIRRQFNGPPHIKFVFVHGALSLSLWVSRFESTSPLAMTCVIVVLESP